MPEGMNECVNVSACMVYCNGLVYHADCTSTRVNVNVINIISLKNFAIIKELQEKMLHRQTLYQVNNIVYICQVITFMNQLYECFKLCS